MTFNTEEKGQDGKKFVGITLCVDFYIHEAGFFLWIEARQTQQTIYKYPTMHLMSATLTLLPTECTKKQKYLYIGLQSKCIMGSVQKVYFANTLK